MDERRAVPPSVGAALALYGLGTAAGFLASGSPGGAFDNQSVISYISFSHFWVAAALWYLVALSALALLVVAAGLRDLPGIGRLVASLAQTGAACSVVGAFVCGGLAVAMAEGGGAVRRGVPHPVVYTITEIGNLIAVCAPALCVGTAALVLARHRVVSGWLRGFTVVAGACGILAPFFFTYLLYVAWTLIAGVVMWRGRAGATPSGVPSPG